MREQHVQLLRLHVSISQRTFRSFAHDLDSEFENLLAVHMNGVIILRNGFFASRVAAAACRLQQILAAIAVSTHVDAQHAIAILNLTDYSSASAVTEEHAGIAVSPVHDAGQGFCTDNQDFVIKAALNHLACYCQAVNKTAAAGSQVESSCIFCTKASLYQARCRRENVIAGSSTHDNQVQLLRSYTSVLQCFHSSVICQIRGCFLRSSDMTLFDTGTLSNPLVTGLYDFFHVCISDNFFRNIMSHT